MDNQKSEMRESISRELQYAYTVLRRFDVIQKARGKDYRVEFHMPIEPDQFGQQLVLRLVEERLNQADTMATKFSQDLLSRLVRGHGRNIDLTTSKFTEVDQYFHRCLLQIHDFWYELNWHYPYVSTSVMSTKTGLSSLSRVRDFEVFRSNLAMNREKVRLKRKEQQGQVSIMRNAHQDSSPSLKSLKSTLAQPISSSSPVTRRVKFGRTASSNHETGQDQVYQKVIVDEQIVFAHLLTLYGFNIFVEKLVSQVVSYVENELEPLNLVEKLSSSKRRLKGPQLESIQSQIKEAHDLYLLTLNQIEVIKREYITERLVNILGSKDPVRVFQHYREPLTEVYVSGTLRSAERRIIKQWSVLLLQVIFDLALNEINIPPTELGASSNSRSKLDNRRSQDNQTSLIASLLNFNWFFGRRSNSDAQNVAENSLKKSTVTLSKFRSSSRILTRIDNLSEVSRILLDDVVTSIRSRPLVDSYLSISISYLLQGFDKLSRQLLAQVDLLQKVQNRDLSFQSLSSVANKKLSDQQISEHLEAINVKIRCIKCAHFFSNLEQIFKDIEDKIKFDTKRLSMFEMKVRDFSERCGLS